jgi:hypothetical protein
MASSSLSGQLGYTKQHRMALLSGCSQAKKYFNSVDNGEPSRTTLVG